MPGLTIHTSNRLEILVTLLSRIVGEPLASPMAREIIVVQSRGMERWIAMQLARMHGVFVRGSFPFPNNFIETMFEQVLPDLPDPSPFDPDVMTWKLMHILPSCLHEPAFEHPRAFFDDDPDGLKRVQLCERIADTFDQYLLFRPEMILEWEQGRETHWQAILWRTLSRGLEHLHRAGMAGTLLAGHDELRPTPTFPERVSVFGISALPRFHLQVLAALSRHTEVHLFLMNPCREYWGDIVPDRGMHTSSPGGDPEELTAGELHLNRGNALLASMGRLGRDFFDLVTEFPCEEFEAFEDPPRHSMLTCIQSDILNLVDRGSGAAPRAPVDPRDESIRIHSCHGPMREMEVLHDRLLHMLEHDPELLPGDILVMAPEIETYAPYIQAVFDLPADDPGRIPFSIADRNAGSESDLIDTLLKVLDVCCGRFGVSEVCTVLESPVVLRKFGLQDADTSSMERWIRDSRIRWGIDAAGRAHMGLPSLKENTWEAGIERLLLGYSLPGNGERMFEGILPYDHVEGDEARVLGKVAHILTLLFELSRSLASPRTLSEWSRELTALLDRFFMPEEGGERALRLLQSAIMRMATLEESSGFHGTVDIRLIRWYLETHLLREGFGHGFITGGVTFCAMLPMRSIPCKTVCLVGMNYDAYPRRSHPLDFDLMAGHPKPGDRSRRNDDRYLFLEALLSARKTLHISYTGQSVQDNGVIPPSVLVSDLLDYLEGGFTTEEGSIKDRVVTSHRLQAFHPDYFAGGADVFSYSDEYRSTADAAVKERVAPRPFITDGLSPPGQEWDPLDCDRITEFFANPCRFLITRRLGIELGGLEEVMDAREPFTLERLDRYRLAERLLHHRMSDNDPRLLLPVIRAEGLLPHGTVGACTFQDLCLETDRFAETIRPFLDGGPPGVAEGTIALSGGVLAYRLTDLYRDGMFLYRYALITQRDYLSAWIRHLVLAVTGSDGAPTRTVVAGMETKGSERVTSVWEFTPVDNARALLEGLFTRYREGLVRPLHFFPSSSGRYARFILEKGPDAREALSHARAEWTGDDHRRGESEDRYYTLCFGDTDPLDREFEECSLALFTPLLQHLRKVE